MAIETDSKKLYDTMMETLMDHCGEALYPGDERRIFAEGLALVFSSLFGRVNDRMQQARLNTASGTDLDSIGAMFRVERFPATPATTTVRFTLSDVRDEDIIIPAGTRVTTDGSVYFATTEDATIPAGSEFADAHAQCMENGTDHNGYAVGLITVLVDLIPYVASVSNITVTSGGYDGEPYTEAGDDSYRKRIQMAPASLAPGTYAGYAYYAKNADPGIVDVMVTTPTDSPNTVNIAVMMEGGKLPDDAMLQKVVDSIENSNTRIVTDHVVANAPLTKQYTIAVHYRCAPDVENQVVEAIEGEGGVIDQYIAWQSSKIGRAIVPDKLQQMMYQAGATTVTVSSPAYSTIPGNYVAVLSGNPVAAHNVVVVE